MTQQLELLLATGEQLAKSMEARATLYPDDAPGETDSDTDRVVVNESRCMLLLELKGLAVHTWAYCRYVMCTQW